MKKSVFFAVMIASATAAMAAKTSSWPVGETFPATFPYPYPSQEPVYPVYPVSFPVFPQGDVFPESVYPVFPGSFPVYPQKGAYPEAEPFEPIAFPFPAS